MVNSELIGIGEFYNQMRSESFIIKYKYQCKYKLKYGYKSNSKYKCK